MLQLVTNINLYKNQYSLCFVSEKGFSLLDDDFYKNCGIKHDKNYELALNGDLLDETKGLKIYADALFLRPFLIELMVFPVYRNFVLDHMYEACGRPYNGTMFIQLILKPPDKEVIDYAWNERMLKIVWTRVEIENAFSWLSTLGGAYSALGDHFEHCAEEAGRISLRQYKLSKMLADEGLMARSRLYAAIAFAQQGRLKLSKLIVISVAKYAKSTGDRRLFRMCQGVWAKLVYLKQLKKQNKITIASTNMITNEVPPNELPPK